MMKKMHMFCLLVISEFCTFTFSSRQYHYINLLKNYTEAKKYCRQMYTDLATIGDSADMDNLISLVPSSLVRAWIGLEISDVSMWHWSLPNQNLDFFQWRPGEPGSSNRDTCVAMTSGGEWFESDCNTQRGFVCDGGRGNQAHIFISGSKSWREAQNHCRNISTDLVSIQSLEENQAVQNVSKSQTVWIGLFKDPWEWSDGSNSSFRFWKPNQPSYNTNQLCVVAVFRDKGEWNDLRCDRNRRFICYGVIKSTTRPSTTVQAAIMSDNGLDQVTSTVSPAIVSTTIYHSSVVSSTMVDTLTTKGITMTNIQQQLSTSMVTDDISKPTTPKGTAAGTSSLRTSAAPPESTQGPLPDNLILIRKNMTWMEALGYCRRHHIDLVSVTNEQIQRQLAKTVENATSSHIWIGLRYSCSFKFWFWISSDAGCYSNWTPGHESSGKDNCGFTGAMEVTRGQHWVGLPQTHELNFICLTCHSHN